MPIYNKDLTKINSPVMLRCDGLYPPFAETASNGAYPANNPQSISSGMIIGRLVARIDIQDV